MIRESTIQPTTAQVGGWYTMKLSDEVRVVSQPKMKFAQLCRPEGRYGPHEGRVLAFNKLGNLGGSGQQMAEFGDVPEDDWTTTQGTVTWAEHSHANRIQQWADMTSELSVTDASVISLTNDGRKYIDRLAAAPFINSEVIYTPTGTVGAKSFSLSVTGTAGATATREFSYWDHQNIMDLMKGTYNIPGFMGDDYVCVATTRFLRGLRTDTELVSIRKYDDPKLILSGEVGNLEGCRFLHENHVQNNSVGTNGVLGEAVYVGADPVIMLEVYPFEIQAAVPDMWGRTRALRWVWFGGFERIWKWAVDATTRIIRVGSL